MYAKGFYRTGNDAIRDSGIKPTISNSLSFCDFCENLVKQITDLFPYALSLGMSYELYWFEDVELIDCYLKKREFELKQKNEEFHLYGQYMVCAIKEALKTNSNDKVYPDKPFELSFNKKEPKNEQEKIEEDIKAMFSAFRK